MRACPALDAFFVRIALGQPTGILLPAGAPAGHGSGRPGQRLQERAAPPGWVRAVGLPSRMQVTPIRRVNTHQHSFKNGVTRVGKMVAFMVAFWDFIFLLISSVL